MANPAQVLVLDSRPITRRRLLSELWDARDRLREMAVTDFRVRYKRAFFGLLWAVALPLLQAAVLAAVFSQFVHLQSGDRSAYAVFILAGVLPWSFFNVTLNLGSVAIVDHADLSEKVWFPRAILPIAPALANIVGLGVSMLALIVATIAFRHSLGPGILLLIPACLLLLAFTVSLCLVLSALHAYFRDVRYFVSAALLVWFYATPVIYPASLLKQYRNLIDFNPMTGVLDIFRLAVGQREPGMSRAVTVSALVTAVLVVAAVEIYRRHDRLFVDTL